MAVFAAGCAPREQEKSVPKPMVVVGDIRGARSERVMFLVEAKNLPADATTIEWEMDLRLKGIGDVSIWPGDGLPLNSDLEIKRLEEGSARFLCRIEAPEGSTFTQETMEAAEVTFRTPPKMSSRRAIRIERPLVTTTAGEAFEMEVNAGTIAVSLISNPVTIFTFLAGVVALVFWMSTLPALGKFFTYLPPLIWMYFIPMICTTLGFTPDSSVFYSPFMSRIMLPAILVLLLIPSDVRAIAQLGIKAVIVMLIATLGIVVGALGSLALCTWIAPDAFPDDAWKGVAALSGSWIGGSPNMTAVIESIETPPSMIGPLIVVDTVLAYSWLGLLIALSGYQHRIDRFHKADSSVIDKISKRLEAEQKAHSRAPSVVDIALMLGIAFVVSQLCLFLGGPIYNFVDETLKLKVISEVVNSYGWAILLITAAGLGLSMTKVRHLDFCGASSIGYVGLYLLLTTYGARANLRAVLEVPQFFALGSVWLLIHIAFLYAGIRLTKAPLFLGATSSMANIGGTASAPVVAAAYNQSMAPVGLLMAILGSTLGTPLSLFVIATVGRAIQGG